MAERPDWKMLSERYRHNDLLRPAFEQAEALERERDEANEAKRGWVKMYRQERKRVRELKAALERIADEKRCPICAALASRDEPEAG